MSTYITAMPSIHKADHIADIAAEPGVYEAVGSLSLVKAMVDCQESRASAHERHAPPRTFAKCFMHASIPTDSLVVNAGGTTEHNPTQKFRTDRFFTEQIYAPTPDGRFIECESAHSPMLSFRTKYDVHRTYTSRLDLTMRECEQGLHGCASVAEADKWAARQFFSNDRGEWYEFRVTIPQVTPAKMNWLSLPLVMDGYKRKNEYKDY
jgi:hypothetical protein